MDYHVCEYFNSEDIFSQNSEIDLSYERIKILIYLFGLDIYLSEFWPMTAERMIFIHSEVDYNFTAKELSWLDFSSEMVKWKTETGINIFAFKTACSPDDYYIPSAAIIKIFNIAFSEDNLFVFEVGQGIAVGCKRTFLNEIPNNFCVSMLFDGDTLDSINALIDELSYAMTIRDYLSALLVFSPQEGTFQKSVDQRQLDPDYLLFLDETQSMYGVNVSLEKEHYIASFSEEKSQPISYRAACNILCDVAIGEDMSSYDFVDAAMEAEEKASKLRLASADLDGPDITNMLPKLSEAAYQNAEIMLTEMLEHPSD